MVADEDSSGAGAIKAEGSSPGRCPIVFVSDASAEAERIADTLRAAGYLVADVPLRHLAARVSAERPHIVLVDVDVDGALDDLARVRRVPGSGAIDFVYLGTGGGAVRNADDALANDGSAFFLRPVDIAGLVRRVEALTGGPSPRPIARPSTPPPSIPVKRLAPSAPPHAPPPSSDRPSMPSLPAPGVRTPGPPLPMSTTSLADLVDAPRSFASFGSVSHELSQLLAEAELRAEVMAVGEVPVPSPEEEIESVLPADVLASLDEPLDGGDDEDLAGERPGTSGGHDREGTGAHAKGTTSGGSQKPTTGSGGRASTGSAQTHERRLSDPPPKGLGGPLATYPSLPRRATEPAFTLHDTTGPRSERTEPPREGTLPREDTRTEGARTGTKPGAGSWAPPPLVAGSGPPAAELRGPSVQPAELPMGIVLGPGDAARFFADAVTRRVTGALCFEHEGTVRRIVVRDGDLVAAASGAELESLVHFLAARGELPRDDAARLSAKVPPYGRHAGAALVAHGWLRQDQLWAVLRAHAEWIASAVLRLTRGTAQVEPDPPGRLRSEPSVFGASTGPEIFVDLVRRSVSPEEALERLGGQGSRIGDGASAGLLAECNLPPQELDLVSRARGGTIADLLARAPDPEIVAVVHALALLGVVDVVPAPDFGRREGRTGGADLEVAALDEEAIRGRVRARVELVEEGDYFAVLGVARDATGYEIRRAFLELRRAFEPSRILTPRLQDLADDVRKIVVVLEEAYEILRDPARRERYRRAIDARPE